MLDKGSGGQEQTTSTNTGPPTHQAGAAPRSAPVHRCTQLPLGAPTCKVVTTLVADQIWCTTCTEPHTRKQTSSSIDSDYHPCPPAHQRFFVALGRSPKAAHRKYEYTVGSCYETERLFTHGGHLPRLPHWPDNRQYVGDQSFLAAAAEQAPTLPGATSGCSSAQVVAPQDRDDDHPLSNAHNVSLPRKSPPILARGLQPLSAP